MQAVAPAPGGPKEAINYLAVLKAKIKIKNPRIRAGIGPKPTVSLGKWQSGPSPGTPLAKDKIKKHFKHSQVMCGYFLVFRVSRALCVT